MHASAEVGKHCTEGDCWVMIESCVLDVTKMLKTHPGGIDAVASVAGRDVTQIFSSFHRARVLHRPPQRWRRSELDGCRSRLYDALPDLD